MPCSDCNIPFGPGPGECKHSQVRWRGKNTLTTSSPTVLCIVAASVVLLATPAIAALAHCQAERSCGGTDDCQVCINQYDRTRCESREFSFCEWWSDPGGVPWESYTAADYVFVVAEGCCKMYTTFRLYGFFIERNRIDHGKQFRIGSDGNCANCGKKRVYHTKYQDRVVGTNEFCYNDHGFNMGFVMFGGFFESLFIQLKLFWQPSYLCRSLDCAKVTHNCVMTLASFPFAAFDCWGIGDMAEYLHRTRSERSESRSTLCTGMVRLLELVLCLGYIIYDVATTEPPGVGTTVLVGVSCLAEVLLLYFEYTVLKSEMGFARVSPG